MSVIVRGYKTELDLNNQQRTLCLKHAGCARSAYNWGLARKQEAYKRSGKMPSAMELHKALNALKATDYPWMYDCSKCAMQEALRDLDVAYKHAFRRLKEKKAGKTSLKVGWPRLKSRNKGIGSFRLTGAIHIRTKSKHPASASGYPTAQRAWLRAYQWRAYPLCNRFGTGGMVVCFCSSGRGAARSTARLWPRPRYGSWHQNARRCL